jgi:opacity protein-like surface antigen
MKLTLLASAAAAVSLFALPALAQTTVNTGYVGASAGFAQADDVDGEILALEGAGTLSLGGTLGLQLDAALVNTEFDEIGTNTTIGGRAHLFSRTDTFLFGGFASVASSEFEDLGAENVYGLGLEAQAYLQQVTLGANIGWFKGDDDESEDSDGMGVGALARFFVNENFSLEAGVDWSEADDDDFTVFSLGAEYKLANSPVSFTAGFSSSDIGDGDDAQAVFIGVRLSGPGSLMDRDRRGPSL